MLRLCVKKSMYLFSLAPLNGATDLVQAHDRPPFTVVLHISYPYVRTLTSACQDLITTARAEVSL